MAPIEKKRKRVEEEPAFPRGGASVLTPLEHKQIQIEATRDVLFEQSTSKPTESKKRKTKGKDKSKKGGEVIEPEEAVVKIEGLNYKVGSKLSKIHCKANPAQRIVPGSLVLGQVSQINDHDIALSLPNNLTGYVPITSISDKITGRIEAAAAKEDEEEDEQEDSDDIDLTKLFSISQYLRAYVVSTSDESASNSSGKSKRHIELSLRPQQSNGSITSQNVIMHNTMMASVISVEDHGIIMDLGLSDSSIRGFMSSKEIGQGVELSEIQEGAVFFCMVTGLSSNGKTVKLTADSQKIGNLKKPSYLTDAPTVDAFLPGTAVEILVADITARGIVGKVMGMVDVTADLMHSGAGASGKDLEKKYKIGSKIKGRVICTFPSSDPPKLGVSLLDHIMALAPQQGSKGGERTSPLELLPLSSIVEEVTVRKVESGVGLFVDVGVKGVSGFVHISRVKDGKIETLSETSGAYKIGSTHRGRLIGYNSLDGIYLISLEPSILEQPYLRIEDLTIGEIVKGKVEKIVVNAKGVGGLLVNLAEGITGLVTEIHMSDVKLLHPEKKFKEGMTVKARVLSTDPGKRQIRLTLKKSLVNSEATPFLSYEDISVGMQSPGAIVSVLATGAVVQFYGTIRGYLPVAEMSEAFIKDPREHFQVGQVVNVHVLSVDPEEKKLTVSCKDPSVFGLGQQAAFQKLRIGEIVSAVVTEKTSDNVSVELKGSSLRATLPIGQLTDGSTSKNASALKKIRVGQTLTDLCVLERLEKKRLIVLTNKPSLIQDAKDRILLRSFDDVKEGKIVHGFVKNITLSGLFIQFGGTLTGYLPKSHLAEEAMLLSDFGMTENQSIEVKIMSIDPGQQRFVLSTPDFASKKKASKSAAAVIAGNLVALNPVDPKIKSLEDLSMGKLTKARVHSVKETQINVQLADNIQGRIDVSQLFDSWDQIKHHKRPTRSFHVKQVLDVRVLGIHDARNHRFLPLSHRGAGTMVFELSAKPSDQKETSKGPLTMDKVKEGDSFTVFVNNVGDDCLWVNLSPNIRGRIQAFDASDDISLLAKLEENFPVGSALKVHVKNVDVASNRLDLSARSSKTSELLTLKTLSKGMVLPGKVTKVTERYIMVQLNDSLSGSVHLTDLTDDFSQADTTKYMKGDIIRVCVVNIDSPNKKIRLSARPSRVLNSSLAVQDPEIDSSSQLKVNDIVRGFVKNVSDKGLFVHLGGEVTGFIRVSDLSDSFLKDWKSDFEIDQLVTGKVTAVSPHVQMSLKASILDKDYVAPTTFDDFEVGQIVIGKIRKVEDFGVFIVIDGSKNVSGLCHQSEMADKRVRDVKKLYEEGDSVKAKIIKKDAQSKRISFGLKASYFDDAAEGEGESDDELFNGMQGVELIGEDGSELLEDSDDEEIGGVDLDEIESIDSSPKAIVEKSDEELGDVTNDIKVEGLKAGSFDWSANIFEADSKANSESDNEDEDKPKKKKRRKAEIKIDRTGDLDANGPQSVSDFERLLLGQPDSSELWIQYMAFQMQLSELSKAREVAERAIKTVNIREETEKLNIWIALLNLENAYGSDETVEEVFKRACQYNDAQEVHERLTSIYIQSGKNDVSFTYPSLLQELLTKK